MSSKSSNRPKRPLTAYNLFYRYKRAKMIEGTTKNSNIDKEDVQKLIETTPGLESYPSCMQNKIPKDQLDGIRRTIIRLALEKQLHAKDTKKRAHKKSGNGLKLSFLEMNKIMVGTWKAADEFTKSIFKELAEEARQEHHRLLIEYNKNAHNSILEKFRFPGIPQIGEAPKLTNSAVHSQDLNSVSTTSTSCEIEMRSLQSNMMELARLQLQFAGQSQPMMSNPSFSGQMQDNSNLKQPAFGASFLPQQQVQRDSATANNAMNSHGNQNLGQRNRISQPSLNMNGPNRCSSSPNPHQSPQCHHPARQVTCFPEQATQATQVYERPSQLRNNDARTKGGEAKTEAADCSSDPSMQDTFNLKEQAFGASFLPHQQVQRDSATANNVMNSHGNQNLGQNNHISQPSLNMNGSTRCSSADNGFQPVSMPPNPYQSHQCHHPARQVTCPPEEATQVYKRPSQPGNNDARTKGGEARIKTEVADCSSESSSEEKIDEHKRNVSVDDFMQLLNTLREDD